MRVREYRSEDYDAVISLWERSGLEYRPNGRDSRSSIEGEVKRATSIFLIAEKGDKVIGSVLVTQDGRKGWINRLCVDPSERRRGIATMLLEEAENRIESLGIEITACLIYEWNSQSLEFFIRKGYLIHDDVIYLTKRKRPDV